MKAVQQFKEKIRTFGRKFAPLLWRAWYCGVTSKWQKNSPFGRAPTSIHPNVEKYLQTKTDDSGVLLKISPEGKEMPLPLGLSTELEAAYRKLPPFEGIGVCVYQLEHAHVFGGYAGMVVTRDARIIQESSPFPWGTQCHPALRKLRWPRPPTGLSGKTALLSTPEASNNYYHFMVDCLPKLALLKEAGQSLDGFDWFIINSSARFSLEVFEKVGIPRGKLILLDETTNLVAENLIVPGFHGSQNGVENWQVEGVRGILGAWISKKPGTKMIYAARGKAKIRRVLNEDDVIRELAIRGFEIIDPGSLSVEEQAGIFSQASVVVAPHGAALTNCIFCQPGTSVVELVHPQVVNGFYRNISHAVGLRHFVSAGQGNLPSNFARHRANSADFSIPIHELQSSLSLIIL